MPTSWKRMDLPQRVATLALFVLAVIALLAALTGCGRGGGSTGASAAQASHRTSGSKHFSSGQGSSGSDNSSDTIQLGDLPKQAQHTVDLINSGGPYPYSRDGVVFGNYEHHLPKKPRGWYHEYTVPTPGASTRGTRRIIAGQDGTLYYTGDHYQTFKKILR